jgi:hypothetical protein
MNRATHRSKIGYANALQMIILYQREHTSLESPAQIKQPELRNAHKVANFLCNLFTVSLRGVKRRSNLNDGPASLSLWLSSVATSLMTHWYEFVADMRSRRDEVKELLKGGIGEPI